VNIISGTSPYIYSWSNGQTTQTATGLNASVYTVTVTDNTGCTSIRTTEIFNNTGNVSINTALQNILCPGGNTGSSTATGTGGTGPYIYSWINGQSNANATGLKTGTYIVTATDVNGCSNAVTIVITEPQFSAQAIQNQKSTCGGATGKATALVQPFPPAPSTGPYTYIWSNGQNTVSATGLSAGGYTVTVTNASGCTSTAIAIIGNSNGPNLSVTNNCSSSKVTAFGGTLPYTYLWNNGQTTQTATNIKAGDYVIVSDASGCYNVIAPVLNPITITVTSAASSCGSNNGSAAAGASGINSWPYTYLWNNAQTTQIATNLAAGTYTVTVTGSNGCTETGTVTVASDNCTVCSLTAKTNINTNVSCNGGGNGSATVLINNGSGGPYIYSWSNGNSGTATGTSILVTGLQAATYTVTISEGVCTSTSTVSIISPPPLSGQFTRGIANCSACGCKEWLMINAIGGTSPYSYSWPDGYMSRYKNQLCTGTYMINIKDKNGCSVNVSLTVP
ncbi:MAG: SprB repeat-containing protein, partial [Bacteroidetes bacterium]|nr:SprB repeat-containing protein [Bacteroidota bacterium]